MLKIRADISYACLFDMRLAVLVISFHSVMECWFMVLLTKISKARNIKILITIIVFVSYGTVGFVYSTTVSAENFERATAFDYSNKIVAMPSAWKNKPVTYDNKIQNADLVISFGQQTHPAFNEFVLQYAKKNKLKIVIMKGSCSVSSRRLREKSVDIAAYCCPVAVNDRLPELQIHTIGIAAISLVTHLDNPVSNLTLSEARKIFQGSYSRWSELPSSHGILTSRKIQPVVRLHCKKRPGHWRALLKNEDQFSPRLYEVGVIPDMLMQVAINPLAIGLETIYMLEVYSSKDKLKTISIDNIQPSDLNQIAKGQYPLYRTYSLTTWKNSSDSSNALMLIREIEKHIENNSEKLGIIPIKLLKQYGWTFKGDELIAEPGDSSLVKN